MCVSICECHTLFSVINDYTRGTVQSSLSFMSRLSELAMMTHAIFTALHGMQRGLTMRFLSVRPSVRLSVCPSVRLSVKRVHCDKTEESYV